MLDRSVIRTIASWKGPGLTTSLYLDVDGLRSPRWPDVERRMAHLFRLARSCREAAVCGDVDDVEADLSAISAWLDRDFTRANTRGLALFSCAAGALFEAIELPMPVIDQVVVERVPDVAQLCVALTRSWSALAAAVDREHCRIVRLAPDGQVTELDVIDDDIPRNVDVDVELAGFGHHEEELIREHYRRVGRRLAGELARRPLTRLVLFGPDETVLELARYLPRDVIARLAGHEKLAMQTGTNQLAAAARDVIELADAERSSRLLAEFRGRAATGTLAVNGLDATLCALGEDTVSTLLVERTYQAPGGRCDDCSLLVAGDERRPCPRCGGHVHDTSSVVDAAITDAFLHDVTLEVVESGELSSLGRIGALVTRSTELTSSEHRDA